VAGDEVNYQIVNGGGGTLSLNLFSVQFLAVANTVTKLIAGNHGSNVTVSTTAYQPLAGKSKPQGVEERGLR